jgi:hypothetical protein
MCVAPAGRHGDASGCPLNLTAALVMCCENEAGSEDGKQNAYYEKKAEKEQAQVKAGGRQRGHGGAGGAKERAAGGAVHAVTCCPC